MNPEAFENPNRVSGGPCTSEELRRRAKRLATRSDAIRRQPLIRAHEAPALAEDVTAWMVDALAALEEAERNGP